MEPTRQMHVQPPRAAVNDPTILTPMPARPLQFHPPAPDAAHPTRTACIGGPNFALEAQAVAMPRIGDLFLGFKIVDKLGEGGFGSVFLAEQLGLAARPVALKFTSRPNREPERLASLQHTNIVPVYSVHTMPPIQVLCMPYLGRQTLHDVLQMVAENKMLPATGAGLLSTLNALKPDTKKRPKTGRATKSHPFEAPAVTPGSGTYAALKPQPVRELLGRLSFPDSVVWLFTRLSEALAHAHERGILHLDLKPSNVLVTDDGVPMILDFGLAHDIRSGQYDQSGGTLRYMSPEQLAAYAAQRGAEPDARMDLYSLGVMFYELLTGQHPFERSMESGVSLPTILAARRAFAPRPRTLNPRIDPAVEAIVLKLLSPDADARYQTAAELLTDLTLHQQHRPLKHTRNPSFTERLRKYRRRHPVLAVMFVAAAFALTAFGTAGAAIQQARQRTEVEAALQAGKLQDAVPGLRIDLASLENAKARGDALAKVEAWFNEYGAAGDLRWREQPNVARLPDADRERLTEELGELALLSAHAERLNAGGKSDGDRDAAYKRALRWNRLAQGCYEGYELPLAVREQRVRLGEDMKQPGFAEEIDPAQCRAEGALELYIRGLTLLAEGHYRASTDILDALVEKEPGHAAGQFALGAGLQYQGRFADAAERYQLAKVLCPKDYRPVLNRGVVLCLMNKHAEARKEFTAAIRRDPKCATAYYHRSLSEARLGRLPEAIADATRALDLGEPAFRTFLLRASLQAARGETAAADRDRVAAAKLEPQDEMDYVARGNAHLPAKPAEALKDYAAASALNPRYLAAWQNQAHVLSEYLDQAEQALDRLDKALVLNPDYTAATVGRAVLLARLGQGNAARQGAERALAQSDDPTVRYQVACVYALLSKKNPDDARTALNHLRVALREQYSDFAGIEKDADLADIRDTKEFRAIIDSAKELRAK